MLEASFRIKVTIILRPIQFHPAAWPAYINACFQAGVNPEQGTRPNGSRGARIMQLIGNAVASAGYHARDGFYKLLGKDQPYCAAIDIRTTDLKDVEVEKLWDALIENGFAVWWRHTGSFENNQHIHCVYAGVPMKKQLRAQIHSFLDRCNGLVGNAKEPFLLSKDNLPDVAAQKIRTLFLTNNRMIGASFDDKSYEADLPEACCELNSDDEGVWGEVEDSTEPLPRGE